MARWVVAVVAAVLVALSLWQLERPRAGLVIEPFPIAGGPPATLFHLPDATPAPVVVIAHGFAGSRQLMEPFALTLAHAGYMVVTFDALGHGRNPLPMSGDVTLVDGTTRLMVDELRTVARAALAHPRSDGRLAYLGHSMASDLVIRAAQQEPRAKATVAISMFSQAVTPTDPANLLILPGEWETRLGVEAMRVLHLTDPAATADQTVGDPARGTARRVTIAPGVEHVGVLYSATARRAATDWLNATFGRDMPAETDARGGWILLLLAAITALGWPLSALMPKGQGAPAPIPSRAFWTATLAPAILTPLILAPFDTRFLPVLVADYLALHFALYGAITLYLLHRARRLTGQFPARVLLLSLAPAIFGILILGTALDRYVASFVPNAERATIILALALGAVPFFLADALLTEGGRASAFRTLAARGAFLASLVLAVALDFDRLMFLLIILPVILLFFLLFGTLSGWIGRRTALPAIAGLGFGLTLAWALGVTFPLFQA
ncbi:alpha/beta hydrolase [Rhodobacteraceae bacterium HSP-20]|uniref:Alpha/beta hydrolase n=1 Tax=Paragemmobacter amnigenus TaxID=2852097 RepID=A0ABS6J6I5_9RHOB|nr:alpha/beta fold hydrolase [Rhodobacter amnigenus]MBU9699198.1 alpha/beta hydrolase [Rhodobacter amnigenus]MBV4390425.1 alpha/beta hydrolase [Rhodobacter amnigenus]